jgi:lipid-A-disaccharide synthase
MKYFIISGEASGDLHGANLIKQILRKDSASKVYCWGGNAMQQSGANFLKHYNEYSVMGFVEVLLNVKKIKQAINQCKQDILNHKPDVVILIDFPGFNLRIAEFCKKHHIKVVYYIAPKVWAWKESRVKKLELYVDLLLIIFPFERDYFSKFKINYEYVGNPLLDEIATFRKNPNFRLENQLDARPIIALLPGSRKQEIKRMMPVMNELSRHLPAYQFVVAGAPAVSTDYYNKYLVDECKLITNQTYQLLAHAHAAIVCSGTATLETALFNVPQVCGYRANTLSYFIAKMLVKIKYISLVNLCMNKSVITELIQFDWNFGRVHDELKRVLDESTERMQMLNNYALLKEALGGSGASDKSADAITRLISADKH